MVGAMDGRAARSMSAARLGRLVLLPAAILALGAACTARETVSEPSPAPTALLPGAQAAAPQATVATCQHPCDNPAMPASALDIPPGDRQFALYYGWPSVVGGANGDVERAAATFARFAVVVFGDGLEHPDHPDFPRTAAVLRRLREIGTTRIFGYVDLGVTTQNLALATVLGYAEAWQRLGAAGILLDDAGADFGVDASRRDAAVDGIHRLGLHVILNAHDPEDAFRGRVKLRPGDGYLFESFQVSDGRVVPAQTALAKADKVLQLALQSGADVYAVATGPADDPGFTAKLAYAWWSSLLYGFRYFQYTTIDYGARTAQLPWHRLEVPDLGPRYLDKTVRHAWSEGLHRRRTANGEICVTTGSTFGGAFADACR